LFEEEFYDTVSFEDTKITKAETFVMVSFWKKEG
jgi:hypothetical protein